MSIRRCLTAACIAALVVLLTSLRAAAGSYEFVDLASGFDSHSVQGPPVIASDGRAVFESFVIGTSTSGLFTGPDVARDALVTNSDGFNGFGSFASINPQGDLAFLGRLNNGTTGIFLGPRPADLAVAEGGPFSSISDPQMDNAGRAVFRMNRNAQQVLAVVDRVGGPVTILAEPDTRFGRIERPFTYHHSGVLAFYATTAGKTGLYVSMTGHSDDAALIAEEGAFITDLRENFFGHFPSVNSRGEVAFVASLADGTHAILTGGSTSDVYVRSGGQFEAVYNALIREDGEIIFQGRAGRTSGVYDEPRATDPILTADDIADATNSGAYNMFLSDSIAIDGTFGLEYRGSVTDGVAIVRPVPEPTSLGALVSSFLLLRRRRSR